MLFEAEIMKIEAKSDLDQLQSRHEAERAQLDEAQAAVQEHAQITAALLSEGQRLQQACMDTHAEAATERELEVLEEVKVMDPDELETNIQSTEARLEMTTGGNAGIIAEYEDRAKKIDRDRARLTGLVETLQQLQSQIEEIKGQWEPRLDALVSEISEAFAENFAKIQCAGEVGVHKDEDFEQWAIQIRVKFR
jgi:chromosome segregation ATPase